MAEKNSATRLRVPWVTLSLAAAFALAYVGEMRAPGWGALEAVFDDYGFNWARFVAHPGREFPTLITSAFLHGDRAHLLGNVVFFLLFASAVERAFGPRLFLICHLLWGAAAALLNGYFSPFSSVIGASGAISGAAGAFFVLHPLRMPAGILERRMPRTQFNVLAQVLRLVGSVPAVFYVGLWFLLQLKLGFYSLMPHGTAGAFSLVAYWAHVGGFAAGALTAFLFKNCNFQGF